MPCGWTGGAAGPSTFEVSTASSDAVGAVLGLCSVSVTMQKTVLLPGDLLSSIFRL